MTAKRNLTTFKLVIYLIIFFTIWSVRELIIQPVFLTPLDSFVLEIIGEAIRLLVWTLPAILLIKHFGDYMSIRLKKCSPPNYGCKSR